MKADSNKSHSALIALALDVALPHLLFNGDISKDEENYLFALEQSFLDCKGFSLHFSYEAKNE